jgi:hypothetical protein
LEITSRIKQITSFHDFENLRDLMLGPAALSTFAHREGRRVNDAVFEPTQECPFTH